MRTVATCSKAEEAHLLRARLEAAGFRAFVQDENLVQMDWLYSNAIGGVRVQVPDEEAREARAFLGEENPPEPGGGLAVACPKCGSPQAGPDELPRRVAILALLLLGLPLLFVWGRWRCRDCRHRWKPEPRPLSCVAILLPSFLAAALLLAGVAILLVQANRILNNLPVLFAGFGLLIFLAFQLTRRRPEDGERTSPHGPPPPYP